MNHFGIKGLILFVLNLLKGSVQLTGSKSLSLNTLIAKLELTFIYSI
jgi:hypothetical protein